MELRHLRYFVTVAEELNMTRAAARLHVSQPPLSRQLRDLEHELGVELLRHGSKPIQLTEAGQVFLVEARAVLKRAADAVLSIKAVAAGTHGKLAIGYAPSLTVKLLPRLLRQFHEQCPGCQIQLQDLSTEAMLQGLREKQLDLALLARPVTRTRRGLEFIELQRHAVCLAVALSHPLAKARSVNLTALTGERLVAFTRRDYPEYHAELNHLFATLPHPPQVAEEHDSASGMIAAVQAGRGIALVHQGVAGLAELQVKLLKIKPVPAPFVVGLAWRRGHLTTAMQRFIAAARLSVPA